MSVTGRHPFYQISIHALRMERDGISSGFTGSFVGISIHALRMERDCPRYGEIIETVKFQSTRSAWSATQKTTHTKHHLPDFNPRAPHGARRRCTMDFRKTSRISIHALRMERDAFPLIGGMNGEISIHALRMERDLSLLLSLVL